MKNPAKHIKDYEAGMKTKKEIIKYPINHQFGFFLMKTGSI
jgi:hypothetical protein